MRKQFTAIFLALIFSSVFCISSYAQNVYNGPDVVLWSQTAVDTFGVNKYTAINARVEINTYNSNDPILSLAPLSTITSVSGQLVIFNNPELTNLDGLDNLTSVGTDLIIQVNPKLTSIAGLKNFTSVGGNILIASNPSLANLTGLENVTSIGGSLTISNNAALIDLEALSNLTSITGTLYITSNAVLPNLDGLENLTSIGINLYIYSNTALTDLNGLKNLVTVGGDGIEIYENSALGSFCGLYNLFYSGTYPQNYTLIHDNLANPTVDEIIAAGPCPSPGVYTGDVDLESQTQVNEFGANGYTGIDGQLVISTVNTADPITDLSGLSSITSISGFLNINNNSVLTNLQGLGNLTSVGQIYIGVNADLKSIAALGNITSVTSNIEIGQNDSLNSLTGLENITTLSGYFAIYLNNTLTDLHALANLKSIGAMLEIHTDSSLTNLDGLESLIYVGGNLDIESNALLTNLDGLKNLVEVGGTTLTIINNASLDGFCGLYKLFSSGTYPVYSSTINGNLANPTVDEIIAAGPCSPPGIYVGDLDLYKQSEVNSIGAILNDGGYVGISGHLLIEMSKDIVDLTPLSSITSVGGYIDINSNDVLLNLKGLENLKSVGEYVNIALNSKLTSLNGLDSLTSIGGSLNIKDNFELAAIDSLRSLTSIGGDLNIEVIKTLQNLNGLENLTSVDGNFNITGWVTTLNGLNSLTSVGGNFDINNNGSLTDLGGLSSLTSIGGDLNIYYVTLTNLDGLEKLNSVGGDLNIKNNSELISFCGLYPLFSSGSYGVVTIKDNGENPTVAEIKAAGPCGSSVDINPSLDIFPATCPNLLNARGKGFIPAAILGTADFDVQKIDPATIKLEGVSPVRWSIKDVAAPVINGEQCDCSTDTSDGYADLNLKFAAQELVAALGQVNDGDTLVLTLTGKMLDETPIEFNDCVIIIAKNLKKDLDDNLNSIPKEYKLFENYPNPFNPSTIINYQLPDPGYVSLIVYDLLGREVATLVNEVKPAGYYQVEFNASALPSGIYLYRIRAGSFVETKKMMLLK